MNSAYKNVVISIVPRGFMMRKWWELETYVNYVNSSIINSFTAFIVTKSIFSKQMMEKTGFNAINVMVGCIRNVLIFQLLKIQKMGTLLVSNV